jgi:pheromone shutdown-related protein TraB
LIGTAHVSRKSVEEVERVIRELRPDAVCVELDPQRLSMLENENSWKKLDIFQVIQQKRVLFLLATLALTAFQKKMGEKDGVRPGSELYAGVLAARELGAELVLADRDVQATLKRTWHNLSFWNKVQITSLLIEAPFRAQDITVESIEELKDEDSLGEMMNRIAEELPLLKTPLIDERDSFLISSIREAKGTKIVGVVGAAHVPGMKQRLHEKVDRAELAKLPPPSIWGKLFAWLLPTLLLLGFYYGYQKSGAVGLAELALQVALPPAIGASLFTLLSLGHPLSVLVAFVVAPFTAIHPAISSGMVIAPLEAFLRKPTVEDCEELPIAIQSVRGVFRNRATRVMLVFLASTFGTAIGTWIGASRMVAILGR